MGCGTSVDVKEYKYQRQQAETQPGLRKSTSLVSDTPSPTCSPWTSSVCTTTADWGSLTTSGSWTSDGLHSVSIATLKDLSELETIHCWKKIFLQRQRTGHEKAAKVLRKTRSDETGSDLQQTDTHSASQSYPLIPNAVEQSRPRKDKLMLEHNQNIFTHVKKCQEESPSVDDKEELRHTVSMEEAGRVYNVAPNSPIRSQVLAPDGNMIYRLRGLCSAGGRGSIGLNYSPVSIDESTSEEMDDSEEIDAEHSNQPVTTKEVDNIQHPVLDCQPLTAQHELPKQKPSDASQCLDDIIQEDAGLADSDQDMSVVGEGFETPSVLSLLDHVDCGTSDLDDETVDLRSLHSVSSHSSLEDTDTWIEEGYYPMAECDPAEADGPLIEDRSSSPPHVISKLLKSNTLPKAKTTSSNPAMAQPNNFTNLLKLPESSHKLGLGDHKFRSSTVYQQTSSSPTLQSPLYLDMSDNSNNCGTARPACAVIRGGGGGSSSGNSSMVSAGDNNDSREEITSCSNIHLHENFFNDFGDNFDDEDFRRL